jgi:ABC-type polysaccharide/polyol phosphate export permease
LTATASDRLGPGTADILESLARSHVALFMAWSDTRARYRRSVLGPLWLTLGTAIGVIGLGVLWSALLKADRATFIPSLAVGLIVWQWIAATLTEATGVFVRQSNVIRNLRLPYFLHPLQLVLRHLINLGHNLLIVVVMLAVLAVPVEWVTLMVLPGLALVVLNLAWLVLLLGTLGARFRDIEYAVASFMPLLFFLSPVVFRPDHLGAHAWMVWMNPLSHLIEVVRAPLLGGVPPWFVYAAVCAQLLVGWLVTLALFNARRNRLAFWV